MYRFGQFRRTQLENYFNELQFTLGQRDTDAVSTIEITFKNACINLSDDNVLRNQNYYYLKFSVKRLESSQQKFYLKLYNTQDLESDEIYTVDEFNVEKGLGFKTFEVILAPNRTYNQIVWDLQRTIDDYSIEEDGQPGRIMTVDKIFYSKLVNVIDTLKSKYSNLTHLTKIGIQSPPSLLMCINGEQIRVGKSGIYEINNENIRISFIGFVPSDLIPSDNSENLDIKRDYFIMDFEY